MLKIGCDELKVLVTKLRDALCGCRRVRTRTPVCGVIAVVRLNKGTHNDGFAFWECSYMRNKMR
jgi:hypothetical protein